MVVLSLDVPLFLLMFLRQYFMVRIISNLYLRLARMFPKISGEELCTILFSQLNPSGNYCSNNSQVNSPPYTSMGDDNALSYIGLYESRYLFVLV
jgi:hypothetical protein